MTLDSHQHFWKYDPIEQSWISDEMQKLKSNFLPDQLQKILVENKIDGCITVQAAQTDEETRFLISLAEEYDIIKGVVGWVDLFRTDLNEKLAQLSQHKKLKGFRHIVQSEPPGFLLNKKFKDGVRKLRLYGYTYDLLIYHHQLSEAIEFLKDVASVHIVIDHIAKPPIKNGTKSLWSQDIRQAAKFQNVYCKISGMVTESDWKHWRKEDFFPYLDSVFETFGVNRILYGSDWPVCLLASTYNQQLEIVLDYISRLSPREQRMVMGENACKVYRID